MNPDGKAVIKAADTSHRTNGPARSIPFVADHRPHALPLPHPHQDRPGAAAERRRARGVGRDVRRRRRRLGRQRRRPRRGGHAARVGAGAPCGSAASATASCSCRSTTATGTRRRQSRRHAPGRQRADHHRLGPGVQAAAVQDRRRPRHPARSGTGPAPLRPPPRRHPPRPASRPPSAATGPRPTNPYPTVRHHEAGTGTTGTASFRVELARTLDASRPATTPTTESTSFRGSGRWSREHVALIGDIGAQLRRARLSARPRTRAVTTARASVAGRPLPAADPSRAVATRRPAARPPHGCGGVGGLGTPRPSAQAAKDDRLLAVAQRCHPQSLRQMRWANAMLKELAPQTLTSS